MKKQTNRWIALATLGTMTLGSFGAFGTPAAHAGAKERKLWLIGAGATTVYGLVKEKKTVAAAGAVGTAVAYHNYRISKKREYNKRDR